MKLSLPKVCNSVLLFTALCATCLWACSSTPFPADSQVEKINLAGATETEDYSRIEQLVRDISIVKLETNDEALVRDAFKLFVTNNRIVIFDKFNNKHQVSLFKRDGTWVASSQSGRGPGEIIFAYDLTIDVPNENIIVSQSNVIDTYDKDLNHLRSTRCDISFNSFAKVQNEYLLKALNIQAVNQEQTNVANRKIIITDPNLKVRDTHYPVGYTHEVSISTDLNVIGNDVYVSDAYCDTIFKYSNGLYLPKYIIDFPAKVSIPSGISRKEASSYMEKQTGFAFMGYYKQTDETQFIRIDRHGRENRNIVMYRNIKTGNNVKIKINYKHKSVFARPKTTFGNHFVSILSYDDIEENLPTLRKVLSPEDLKKVEQMKEEDNPILIFYRIDI